MTEYTNDDNEFDADDLGEALARFQVDRPARDVVPSKGLDRETILALNAAAGTSLDVHEPGELTPEGVGPTRITDAAVTPLFLFRADLDAAGVAEWEVPNVRIL